MNGLAETPSVKQLPVARKPVRLNQKEMDILLYLSNGKQYGDIAEILDISRIHVAQHVLRIKNKLGAGTIAGAVGLALRNGIIH